MTEFRKVFKIVNGYAVFISAELVKDLNLEDRHVVVPGNNPVQKSVD